LEALSVAAIRVRGLALETHALCGLLRYSGPDIDPARFAGVLRAALRDSPGRLARDGYVSVHCAAQFALFPRSEEMPHPEGRQQTQI
jgi:hypothetical protein